MKRRLAALAAGLIATALACQIVAGIERVDKADPPPPEAGPDTFVPDSAVPDPCNHVRPLKRTGKDDAPNDAIPDLYLALREVKLFPDAGQTQGFDLDESCTCDTRPGTKFDGGPSCVTSRAPQCDLDGGVDNQAVTVLGDYTSFIDLDKASNINNNIAEGKQTSILLLKSYNGTANDSDVKFGIFTSEGMLDGPNCPGSKPDLDGISNPGWCGEDIWTASERTVKVTGTSFVQNSIGSGYVIDYQFVAELNGPATIPFGNYRLTLGSPVSTGKLVPLDANLMPIDTSKGPQLDLVKYWRVENAVLGGRVPVSELLAAAGTVNTPGDAGGGPKPPLCTGSLFTLLKQTMCDAIDISSSKELDFVPNARCDSLSVAIGLTAGSVKVNRTAPATAVSNDCYPTEDGGGPVDASIGVDYQCH